MKRHLKATVVFAALAALIVLTLNVLNWLPGVIDKGNLKQYGSLQEARSVVAPIFMPKYFPKSLKWPPSIVIAQTSPYRAIGTEFVDIQSGATSLIISQSESLGFDPFERLKIAVQARSVTYDMNGLYVTLTVGSDSAGSRISMLRWREEPYTMTLAMRGEPFELVRIAQSMIK